MHPAVRLMEQGFLDRVQAPRWWGAIAYRVSRLRLALLLALLPALVTLAAVAWGPEELAKAITGTENVHQAFARFIGAVATASAIAVSVAALTLRRELHGLGRQEQRHDDNEDYRERVRRASGRRHAPLALGAFLGTVLEAISRGVEEARDAARREGARPMVRGLALDDYLDSLGRRARSCSLRLHEVGRRPNDIASAALDFEFEMTSQLAREFARADGVGDGLREALLDLEDRLADLIEGIMYAKTLDTQWGFSRMSVGILLAAFPAIFVATGMVLAYGQGAVDALGRTGAGALVAGAIYAVALPLALFGSYLLRFVFLNEYTLPTDAFVLGPEEPEVLREDAAARGPRGRPGGPA